MEVLPIIEVLWQITAIFSIIFILFYLFIVIHKTVEFQQSYANYLGRQVGISQSIDFEALKITRPVDSVFFVFKDDPEICAALNMNNDKDQHKIESKSQNKKINKINQSKCKSNLKHLYRNSSDDMTTSSRNEYNCNFKSSLISNSNKDNNLHSTVTTSLSTYPITTNNSTNDLLKVRFHPDPPVTTNKILKMKSCIVNKNISTHSTNHCENKDVQQTCKITFRAVHESLFEYNRVNQRIMNLSEADEI